MPKAILEFNLPEEKEEFELANKAAAMSIALFDTRQEVFRPSRKHGYNDPKINEMIELINKACDTVYSEQEEMNRPSANELIYMLEQRFSEILVENNIED